MNLTAKQHRSFFYFITAVAALRLLLAPHVGLGVDEAHYVLYALNLDLSYFDHPPLVGWVQYLFTSVFGTNEFGARVAAIVIGFITSVFIYKLIYDIDKNSNHAFVAVLALYASFLFNALFIMLMPDTLLFLLILPVIFTVIAIENENSLKNWLLLGVLLGIAGLSKYTAILFIVPIVLYILIKKRFDLLYTPKIIPAILVALFIISPVLIWNIQNNWSSFTYQSEHVVGESGIDWSGFFKSLAAQFGAYNPFLFPLALYGLYKALYSKNPTLFLSALFGLVLISFFTYAALYKTALPHWSALFYMLFIPIGSYYALQAGSKLKKYLYFSIAFGLLLSALAYAELAFKFIPQKDYQSLHRDIYGWDTIMQKANEHIDDREKQAIAVTNWTLASRAIYYNKNYDSEVFLIDTRDDQFDIWEKDKPIGKDLLVITTHFFQKDIRSYMKCDEVKQVDSFDIIINNNKINSVQMTMCTNFQGLR